MIHIMSNDKDDNKVRECWDKFSNISEDFHNTPSFRESMQESGIQIHDLSTNFEEFKKVVQSLKDNIDKVKEKKVKKK